MGAEGSFSATNTYWIREGVIETNGRRRPNPRFAYGTYGPSDFSLFRLWTDAKIACSNSTAKRLARLVTLSRLAQARLRALFQPHLPDRTSVMAATS